MQLNFFTAGLWKFIETGTGLQEMTCVILLFRSVTNSAVSVFHGLLISLAIGTKWCVVVRQVYFIDLLIATFVAAAPAFPLFL